MNDTNRAVLRFEGGSCRVDALQAEISNILDEVERPTAEVAEMLSRNGLKAADLAEASVEVSQENKGFGDVIILVTIATASATHLIDRVWDNVWDDLIWPRLKSRLGADAVGEKSQPEEKSGE